MQWLEAEPGDKSEGFTDQEIRVAIAALFYRIIVVDGEIKHSEKVRLREILRERFGLDNEQIDGLSRDGKDADENAAGVFTFTIVLNRELDVLERNRVFSQMQALAMADGEVHPLESDLLQHVKGLLRLDG